MKNKIIIPVVFLVLLTIFTTFLSNNIYADEKEIKFEDKNFYEAIKQQLESQAIDFTIGEDNQSIKISSDIIKNITYLGLSNNEFTNISEIENFTNLTYLYIDNSKISDISGIDKLVSLTDLHLDDNNISDISSLEKLSKLTNLYLNNNNISDISNLANLKDLIRIELNNNNISNIDAVKKLTNLQFLYLENNNISDISALQDCNGLLHLKIDNNNVSDISVLENKNLLVGLWANNNNISDISALKGHNSLYYIELSGNNIKDVLPLENLLFNLPSYIFPSLKLQNNTIEDITYSKKYKLPSIIAETQNLDSNIYKMSEDSSLQFSNCSLSDDKQSVILNDDLKSGQKATVTVVGGKADNTKLTITLIEPLEFSITKEPNELTNKDVRVTIISNKQINSVDKDDWVISDDKKNITKVYTTNSEESVTLTDIDGIVKNIEVKVDNIDKDAPKVEYSKKENKDGSIEVILKANEQIKGVDGWSLSEDKTTLTKTYTDNIDEEVTIYDLAGNETKLNIKEEKINSNNNNPFTADTFKYLVMALVLGIGVFIVSSKNIKMIKNK